MYRAVIEYQQNNVGIFGPALKFLAQSHYKYTLHLSEEEMPLLSNGWFKEFKRQWNLYGYKIYSEAGSHSTVDPEVIDEKIRAIKGQVKQFDKNIFNFDETVIYYARSPTKTISFKSVSGAKADKKLLTRGLLCSSDGKFRMNPCIIGRTMMSYTRS